jgi:hypothetical protein
MNGRWAMRIFSALVFGAATGLGLGCWAWLLGAWPITRAEAQAGGGFAAISVSAASAGPNTTQAWFVGKDGSARVCFSTGRASQCLPVAY